MGVSLFENSLVRVYTYLEISGPQSIVILCGLDQRYPAWGGLCVERSACGLSL